MLLTRSLGLLSIAAVVLQPMAASAATVRYTLGAQAGVSGASNPFLIQGGDAQAALFEATIEPNVTVAGATGSQLEVAGSLTGRQYSRRYGDYVFGNVQATGTVRTSEQLTATAIASYNREVSIDALTTSIGAIADPRSLSDIYRGSGSLLWRPDARNELEPTLSYEKTTYTRSTLLRDSEVWDGDLAYRHRISERTRIGLRAGGTVNRSSDSQDFNTYTLFLTAEHRLSPAWRLSAQAGLERVDLKRTAFITTGRSATQFAGSAALCRDGEQFSACFEGAVRSELSGLGGVQRRYSGSGTITRMLDRRLRLNLQGEYQRAKTIAGPTLPTLEAMRFQAGLDWLFNPQTTLGTRVEYLRRESDTGRSPRSTFVGLRLSWRSRA